MNTSLNPTSEVSDLTLLTAQDVAAILKIKKTFAYDLIRQGRIPSIRLGEKAIRVRKSDLIEFINNSVST